ncbi:MAG: T9SS type A sorting domain-containing protein [Ignavibacteriae bacterium]|nr:T9SS type A sorting domain-containing protein [Ignavibacteriota bacterium]
MSTQWNRCFLSMFSFLVLSSALSAQEWELTDSLRYRRFVHTATRLADGRVLVVGGSCMSGEAEDPNNYNPPSEIYDPVTETWSEAPPLSTPRWGHTAVLLEDGRVLIAGGSYPAGTMCEIYNPQSNTFEKTGALNVDRMWASAVRLQDGRVFIHGGSPVHGYGGDEQGLRRQPEIYDPVTGKWSWSTPCDTGSPLYTPMTLLPDGRVLTIVNSWWFEQRSGVHQSFYSTIARIFDPVSETWSDGGWEGPPIHWSTLSNLADSSVVIAGGVHGSSHLHYQYVAARYDPKANTWGRIDSQLFCAGKGGEQLLRNTLITQHVVRSVSITTLTDGTLLLVSSFNDFDDKYRIGVQTYDHRTGEWNQVDTMHDKRWFGTTTLLEDGRVLVVGGDNRHAIQEGSPHSRERCELFNPGRRIIAARPEWKVDSLQGTIVRDEFRLDVPAEREVYDSIARLYQNVPNPFNPVTTIDFDLYAGEQVSLVVYDIEGREIDRLVDDYYQPGRYRMLFDASGLPSGIYIYRLVAGKFSTTKKMVLRK